MESILTSVKLMLGITEEDTFFDQQLIMHINSAFLVLTQIGIGPEEGFLIEDDSAYWEDFIQDSAILQAVKSYMGLKVKLLFDPPVSSSVLQATNNLISEYEWRLNVAAD